MPFAVLYRTLLGLAAVVVGAPQSAAPYVLRFEDATTAAGIGFVHDHGGIGAKHLPETMGSGVGFLDYDRDGRHDLYLVQSGTLPGTVRPGIEQTGNVLYRNRGDGTFAPVVAGVDDRGYGMGMTAADYDNDGFVDLFVTNYGPNVLYRNNGDGTFSLAAEAGAGADDERWSASAAWGDLDDDGFADLYVTHYVAYDPDRELTCGDPAAGTVSYCHIDLFDGLADSLFRNRGNGTFEDVTERAGVANAREGKGLGVALGDLDGDGRTDIYVANDTQQNFLYANRGDWTFEDLGLFSGSGYSAEGKAQAGMGTALLDLDGDLVSEILVTNFAFEPNNVYRRFAPDTYLDETFALGLGEPGLATLAFGIVGLDADADGDVDVVVANGHILDTVERLQDGTSYAQRNHLFRNHLTERRRAQGSAGDVASPATSGPLLTEVSADAGPGFALVEVTRGLAVGDFDGDGLPDLALTNSAGPARLLANASDAGNRLVLRLRGRAANRDGLGAVVTVTPTGGSPNDGVRSFPQVAEVRSASSYLSQNASDLYFGLGEATAANVGIVWPDGEIEDLAGLAAERLYVVVQGRGVAASRPAR